MSDPAAGVSWGTQAFFCSFNYSGRFKNKRRPEKFFSVSGVGLPVDESDGTAELEIVPFCPSRVSPLAHLQRPVRGDDTCTGTPSFPIYTGPIPPSPLNPWDIAFFTGEAKQYPFSDVAALAVQVVSGRLRDVWVGDPAKAVMRPNGISILGHELEVRGRLMDEVLAGRMWGPLPRPPFPNAQCNPQPRSVPLQQAPKKKHDPTNLDFRLISNQSSGRPSS